MAKLNRNFHRVLVCASTCASQTSPKCLEGDAVNVPLRHAEDASQTFLWSILMAGGSNK